MGKRKSWQWDSVWDKGLGDLGQRSTYRDLEQRSIYGGDIFVWNTHKVNNIAQYYVVYHSESKDLLRLKSILIKQ